MKILDRKIYPKILWHKILDPDIEFKNCIEGYSEYGTVMACYNGIVNASMISVFKQKLNQANINYNDLLILATHEDYAKEFNNNEIKSIVCHKSLLELPTQNFIILNVEKQFDIISISRKSKRNNIESFLKYNFASITWDCCHYPSPESFTFINQTPFSPSKVCEYINMSKFGFFICDLPGELLPLMEFWLCGIPAITNECVGGRMKYCNEKNSIFFNQFNNIHYSNNYDKILLRELSIQYIQEERKKINFYIQKYMLNDKQMMLEVDENDLPRW